MGYKYCRFCGGRKNGCIACSGEEVKHKKLEGLDMLSEPLFVAEIGNESDMELLEMVLNKEAIESAYNDSKGYYNPFTGLGGGMQTIKKNANVARVVRRIRRSKNK